MATQKVIAVRVVVDTGDAQLGVVKTRVAPGTGEAGGKSASATLLAEDVGGAVH